jgi:hypothetical protein
VNEKKGTHLFFNTSKGKIKFGFYCRDDEFNEQVLSKSEKNVVIKVLIGVKI